MHQMPQIVLRADETADYYEYAKGTFDPVTKGFSANGQDVAQTITHGSSFWRHYISDHPAGQTAKPYYAACSTPGDITCPYGDALEVLWMDDMTVCIGKSTQEWVVRHGGNIIFKQIRAMKSIDENGLPAFDTFENHTYTYDSLGHLTGEVVTDGKNSWVSRTLYQASWAGSSGKDCEQRREIPFHTHHRASNGRSVGWRMEVFGDEGTLSTQVDREGRQSAA